MTVNQVTINGFNITTDAALPGNGRTVATVPTYLANNAVFNVMDYGAKGDNTTDDTAAINATCVAAGTDGLVFFPGGKRYRITGTVTFFGPVMGKGALINYAGPNNTDAVQIGAAYSGVGQIQFVQNEHIHLPRLVNVNKTGLGWTASGVVGTVGVRVRHTYNSTLFIQYVQGFETGVLYYGEHDGCDYNSIHNGYLYNNKRNLVFDSTSDGWTNENNVWGGRIAHDPAEGVNVVGTRQILMLGTVGGVVDLFNNHRFRGVSLEGDVSEYHVETKASDCIWDHCRWETNAESPKFLSNGTNATGNIVRNGYAAHNIVFTTTNGAAQPRVETRNGFAIAGVSTGAVLNLVNQNSSASPVLQSFNAGQDLLAASVSTAWVWQMSALGLTGKATGDATASPRFNVDPTTGIATVRKLICGVRSDLQISIDAGSGIAIADGGGTATIAGFLGGMVMLGDGNTGNSALVWLGTGATVIAGGANFTTTLTTAGKYNVAISGGNLVIENRRGAGVADMHIVPMRIF